MDKAKILSSNVTNDTEQNMLKTLFENARSDGGYIGKQNFEDETADGLDILKTAIGKRPEFRTAKETAEISAAAALKNASGRTVPSVMRIFPEPCSKVRMSGTANFAKRFCPKSSSG